MEVWFFSLWIFVLWAVFMEQIMSAKQGFVSLLHWLELIHRCDLKHTRAQPFENLMVYWNRFVLNLAEYTPKLSDDIAKKKQQRCQYSVCSTVDV